MRTHTLLGALLIALTIAAPSAPGRAGALDDLRSSDAQFASPAEDSARDTSCPTGVPGEFEDGGDPLLCALASGACGFPSRDVRESRTPALTRAPFAAPRSHPLRV